MYKHKHERYSLAQFNGLTVIGEGGQSTVYGSQLANKAVKVYSSDQYQELVRLQVWLEDGIWNNAAYCAAVPTGMVLSEGRLVGYSMELLAGFSLLSKLYLQDFCGNNRVSLKTIAHLFIQLHEYLESLHCQGFRIGDLNGSNIMVKVNAGKCKAVKFIDVDSWGFLKPGTHSYRPRYYDSTALHVLLPTKDGADNQAYFNRLEEIDWCAYAMVLAHAIFKVHPFEIGVIKGRNLGLTKRQQEGLTAWNPDVRLNPFEQSLKSRLGAPFGRVLDDWLTTRQKGRFPKQALLDFVHGLVACMTPGCNFLMTHQSVGRCPKCQASLLALKPPARPSVQATPAVASGDQSQKQKLLQSASGTSKKKVDDRPFFPIIRSWTNR